jgi:hypothetical protein
MEAMTLESNQMLADTNLTASLEINAEFDKLMFYQRHTWSLSGVKLMLRTRRVKQYFNISM